MNRLGIFAVLFVVGCTPKLTKEEAQKILNSANLDSSRPLCGVAGHGRRFTPRNGCGPTLVSIGLLKDEGDGSYASADRAGLICEDSGCVAMVRCGSILLEVKDVTTTGEKSLVTYTTEVKVPESESKCFTVDYNKSKEGEQLFLYSGGTWH
jgi:hypothetical protein